MEAGSSPDWAARLSAAQARRAAGWALTELSGLPEWFEALAVAHPRAVQTTLGAELRWELPRVDSLQHPHTLHTIQQQPQQIQKLVAPIVKAGVLAWPKSPRAVERANVLAANLELCLNILARAGAMDSQLADTCEARFLARPSAPESISWIRALLSIDLERGLGALRRALARLPVARREAQAVIWFGALFGHYAGEGSPLSIRQPSAETLAELIYLSYGYVRRENDVRHEGAYSPGPRDLAQNARNHLLNALFGLPGPAAHAAIRSLADHIQFSDMPDRLRLIARRRAAEDR